MQNISLLALVCFLGMISPGPDFLIITKNSLAYSKRKGLLTAFGVICSCAVHSSYCLLGLALVITKNIIIFSTIKYLGASYLIYVGFKAFTSKELHIKENTSLGSEGNSISDYIAFKQGFFCNLLNPKLAVFLLSLFTQFISIDAGLREKSIVSGIFFLEALLYWPILVLMLQTSVVRLTYVKVGSLFNRTCGALLIILGFKVAFSRN